MIVLVRRLVNVVLLLGALAMLAIVAAAIVRRDGDMPWTPLDLGAPLSSFTMAKLAALRTDIPRCHALIDRAGVRYAEVADRTVSPECGYRGAVRLTRGGARTIAFAPAAVMLSCPVAAADLMWEWDVIGPASIALLGSPVVAIRHYGSYNCRRIDGRATGSYSEHARANAIDIAGFVLADGRTITIARDWRGAGREARFLHIVRDGACRAFATVLSPDYNRAHADHLHLDQAPRGALGAGVCR